MYLKTIGQLFHVAMERLDLASELSAALQTLPVALRSAVLMRDIQDLSYQEIAQRLDLPEGTVKSRINRGRKELARQLRRLRDQSDRETAENRRLAAEALEETET